MVSFGLLTLLWPPAISIILTVYLVNPVWRWLLALAV